MSVGREERGASAGRASTGARPSRDEGRIRAHFLGRCSDEELATLAALWERLLPGSTS